MKRYLRPLELSWGSDARRAIAERRAGRLGGSEAIAFSAVEVILRDGAIVTRQVTPYSEARRDGLPLAAIESSREFGAARPLLMGIVNVTPDSFSDGGLYARTD